MPKEFDWYGTPRQVIIPVHSQGAGPGPLSDETEVILRYNGETVRIVIPTWAYDEETSTAPVLPVWEMDGTVLFRFPPTCLGSAQFTVPKDEVESWLKQEDMDVENPGRIRNYR